MASVFCVDYWISYLKLHLAHPEKWLKNISISTEHRDKTNLCLQTFCHEGSLLIYWEQMKFLFSVVLNFKPPYLIGKGHTNSASPVSYYWMFMEYPALSRELTQWQGAIWSQEMLKETIKMSCREGSNKDTFCLFHKCSLIWKDIFIKYNSLIFFPLIAGNYFLKIKWQDKSTGKVACWCLLLTLQHPEMLRKDSFSLLVLRNAADFFAWWFSE